MKIILISIVSYLIFAINQKSKIYLDIDQPSTGNLLSEDCANFNILNNKIRDAKISKQEALRQFQLLLSKIKLDFYQSGAKDFPETSWYFPVQNYGPKAIGGTNGSGYTASKYDYFDGNKHLGHPAQDIFITDKNRDLIDDLHHTPVNFLSVTGAVVISTDTSWNITSNLRGGKYIWIYDPGSNSLFYYAHNSTVFAKPGDIIKPGNIIATVGRTGFNAYKTRSPTHLHIMQLKLDDTNCPKPYNCYKSLVKAKVTG